MASVSGNIEAAHAAWNGRLHGHSYVAELWFEAGPDLPTIGACWGAILGLVDHTRLEESIGAVAMEALAAWLLTRAQTIGTADLKPIRVVVRRPTLGYVVEARA